MADITEKLEELATAKEFLTQANELENKFTNEIKNGFINLHITIYNFGAKDIYPKYNLERSSHKIFQKEIIFKKRFKLCKLIYRFPFNIWVMIFINKLTMYFIIIQ